MGWLSDEEMTVPESVTEPSFATVAPCRGRCEMVTNLSLIV